MPSCDCAYAVAVDSTNYLIVRDIPYLDSNRALQKGAFVAKLVYATPEKVKQENHQVFFTGSPPHNLDGTLITNIGGGVATLVLSEAAADIVVTRQFSNKPIVNGQKVKYPDFFAKIKITRVSFPGPRWRSTWAKQIRSRSAPFKRPTIPFSKSGAHSQARRRSPNLRAVQLLLGHRKIDRAVRSPGIKVYHALAIGRD